MRRLIAILSLAALMGTAGHPASAECYADYKAKRGAPLQLQYGVIALPDSVCASPEAAAQAIAARISVDGWTLLQVVSIFDARGLNDKKRRRNAGEYFLRY